MKKCLLAGSALLLFLASCTRCPVDNPNGLICTRELRIISAEIVSANSHVVALDSVFTERTDNGERLHFPRYADPASTRYTVLDDSYHDRMVSRTVQFRFVGMRGGVRIFDEPYSIGSDGCHIMKRSGKDTIVVQ